MHMYIYNMTRGLARAGSAGKDVTVESDHQLLTVYNYNWLCVQL